MGFERAYELAKKGYESFKAQGLEPPSGRGGSSGWAAAAQLMREGLAVEERQAASDQAWASGANTPEQPQQPESIHKREKDQDELKRRRGTGVILSGVRLGQSGVEVGSNKLGV